VNAGRRPALLGTLVRERGPEVRAPRVRCTTRAGGPRSWGALHNAGRRPALLGALHNAGQRPALLGALHNAGQRPALLGYSAPMIWRGEGIRRDLAEFKGHLHRRTVGLLTWLDRRGCVPYSRTGFSHH